MPSAHAEEVVERANSGPILPDDVCEIRNLGESSSQSPSEPESEPEPVRELDVTPKSLRRERLQGLGREKPNIRAWHVVSHTEKVVGLSHRMCQSAKHICKA